MRLIYLDDAIEAIASRDETDGTVKVFTGREINKILSDLPSAQPEQKKGKWLRSGNCIFPYECDQCGDTNERATPFCPNCGSYNGGEQE